MKKYFVIALVISYMEQAHADTNSTAGLTVITAGDSENAPKVSDPRMLQIINVMDMNNHDPLTGQILGPLQLKLGQNYTLQISTSASIQYFGTSLKEISRSPDSIFSNVINVILNAQSLGQTGIKVTQPGLYDEHYQCMVVQ